MSVYFFMMKNCKYADEFHHVFNVKFIFGIPLAHKVGVELISIFRTFSIQLFHKSFNFSLYSSFYLSEIRIYKEPKEKINESINLPEGTLNARETDVCYK